MVLWWRWNEILDVAKKIDEAVFDIWLNRS